MNDELALPGYAELEAMAKKYAETTIGIPSLQVEEAVKKMLSLVAESGYRDGFIAGLKAVNVALEKRQR